MPIMIICFVAAILLVSPVFPQGCKPETGLYVDVTSTESTPPYGCQTSPYPTLSQAIAYVLSGSGGTIILAQQSSPQVFGLLSFTFSQAVSIQGNQQILEVQGQVTVNEGVVFYLSNASLQFNSNVTSPAFTLVGFLDLEHVIVTGSTIQWGTMTGALSFTSCVIRNTEKELMTASQFGVQLLITDSQFFNNSAALLLFQPTVTSPTPTVLTLQSSSFQGGTAPSFAMYIDWTQFEGFSIPGEEYNSLVVTNCTWTDFSSPALVLSTWFISVSLQNCAFFTNAMGIEADEGSELLLIANSSFISNLGPAVSIPNLGAITNSVSITLLSIEDCVFRDNGQGLVIETGGRLSVATIINTVLQHNGKPNVNGGCLSAGNILVFISNLDFDGCVGDLGPAIYFKLIYDLTMTNIQVRNSHGSEGVGFYFDLVIGSVNSTVFANLSSDGSILFGSTSQGVLSNLTILNCTAEINLIHGHLCVWNTNQFFITNNTAGGQIVYNTGMDWQISVTDSSFLSNFVSHVFISTGGNPASFINCHFHLIDPNTILFVSTARVITLQNCTLTGDFLSLFRGLLPNYLFSMTDSVLKDAKLGWLFDGTYYSATVSNTLFSNVSIIEGSSVSLFKVNFELRNVTLFQVRGEVFYLSKSNIYGDNVVVKDYQTYQATTELFPMMEMWETHVELTHFYVYNFTGLIRNALFGFNENSVAIFVDCSFSDLSQSDHSAGLISVSQSSLTFDNVFVDNWTVTLFTVELATVWLYSSTFTRGGTGDSQLSSSDFDGGLVNGLNVVTFWMENCFVGTIGARRGGVMYLSYDVPTQPILHDINEFNTFAVVINSTFDSSTATEDGGMIYISEGSASLYNSSFSNSSAGRNGGFFNFLCNPLVTDYTCIYNLTNLSLTHSSAGQDGGAIKYNRTQPTLTNIQSIDNTAVYGPFIAGYQVNLGFVNVSSPSLSQDLGTHSANELSGQAMNTVIYFGLYDLNGQLVRTDNYSTMRILMSSSANSSALLTGQLIYTFKGGLCLLNQTIIVTNNPGSSLVLHFTSDAIDYAHPDSNTGLTPAATNLTYTLRNCTKGEIIKDNMCYECPQGTYSFSSSDAFFCKPCLIGMNCYGGANAAIQSGYWSPSIESEEIYVCPQSSTCVGGNGTECETGCSSRLCSVCIDGWFAYGRGLCAQCASLGVEIMQGGLILHAMLLYLLFIIRKSILAANDKQQSTLATELRILINFVQIMMLMNHFQIDWPVTLSGYFDGLYTSGNSPSIVFSIDCFYSQEGAALRLVYVKLIIISILPVFVVVISSIIWSIVSTVKRKIMFLTQHNICSICVLLITHHPLILLSVLKLLTCTPMEQGSSWLVADTSIQCWVGEHTKYVLTMAVPVIIIWCIGIPAVFYLYFMINRKRLKEEVVMRRLAFLYSGYNEDSYYWEFVVMVKKSFFVLVANFLSASNGSLQSYIGLFGLSFFLILHIAKQPYKRIHLNKLVEHSLLAPVVTLMCGLVVDTYLGTTEALYYLLLILIYSVNANYVLRAISGLVIAGRQWLGNKFPKLRRCLYFKKKKEYIPAEVPQNQISPPQRLGLT